MWVMTNLKAEDGLNIYLQREEESFRDLNVGDVERRDHMRMVALLLIDTQSLSG